MKYSKLLKSLTLVMAFGATALMAQTRYLRGKVTNTDGGPLEGASVKVVGTEISTTTNAEGAYTLAAPSTAKQLQVSASTFKTTTVDVQAGSDVIDVNMEPDPLGFNSISITAMALQREKRSLGYATTQVSGTDASQGKDRSVFNGLQGKVAGLNISSAGGTPGSSTRIQLRGATSIGDNQPLIVIDGIPIDNSSLQNGDALNRQVDNGNRANDINPDDVETIDVLKGPAAAVLYGSRASNGAIIITTKSGKGGMGMNNKTSITYNTSYSWENFLKLPEYQNEFGQGGDFNYDSRENWSWGEKFDGSMRPWGQEVDGKQRVKPYTGLPNNVKDFFRNGHTFTNNVSLTGGTDKIGYYFSVGDLRSTNPIPGTDYRRNTVKASASLQLPNNFYSNFSLTYMRTNSNVSTQGQAYSFYDQVLQTPRDIPLNELKDLNNPFNSLANYYGAYTLNPYYILETSKNNNVVDNVLGIGTIGYKYKNWLDIMYRVGTNFYTDGRFQYEPKIEGILGQNSTQAKNTGFYFENINRVSELNSDLIANIKRQLHKDVKLNIIMGQNIRKRIDRSTSAQTTGLVVPGFYNLSNSDGRPEIDNSFVQRAIMGVYADAGFNFKDYLYLNLTGRNDWSSTLPSTRKSYFYPGASLAWVFSSALKLPDFMRYGKVRVAAATVGKDASPYLLTSTFNTGTIGDGYNASQILSPYGTVPGYERGNRIGNPNLKPEFTTSREVGVELAFFKNDRLGVDFTYYNNLSKDIIFPVPLAPSTGFTTITLNAASFTNRGVELLLKGTPILTDNFRWNMSFIYTKNKNKVTELYPGIDQVTIDGVSGASIVAAVGRPFGTFYVVGEQRTSDGKIIVDSTTGIPKIASTPQYYGTYNPDYTITLRNSFTYKRWTLNIQFDHRQGGMVYSRTKDILEFVGTSSNTLSINGDRTDRKDDVLANSVYLNSKGEYVTNTTPAYVQDFWIDQKVQARNLLDATFTKLREVSLNFDVPKDWLGRTPFGNATLGIAGRNLLIWTPKSNTFIDPETNSFGASNAQGFDFGSLPTLRTITLNLRVTF